MTAPPLPPRLTRQRRLARAALWFEQIWPAIWPATGTIGLYFAFALLDGPALLWPWARIMLLAGVVAAAAFLLWRGLRRIAPPDAAAADRRIESDSALRHRPLAALADRPADPTPEQEAIWRVHLARLSAAIPGLVVRRPRPGLASRDGFALRGGLVVLLAAALVVAGADAPSRLLRAVVPSVPPGPAGPGTAVQAWVTPPAYTGLPPVLLRAGAAAPFVPAASRLTVSVTGSSVEPSLALDTVEEPFRSLDATSWQAERTLGTGRDGDERLEIRRGGDVLAGWTLQLIPDQPPVPQFTEPPGRNVVGARPTLQTRLAWQATDDYGVTSLLVELRLVGRLDAPPLVVPIPLAGAPKSARGVVAPDLTAHPWAGLPVLARLVAKDAPGQTGTSDADELTLPAREFRNPVARALIEVRRQLSLTPNERQSARAVIDGIAEQPASFDNSTGLLLNFRALSALLERGRGQAGIDEAQARMWTLALALEENAPDRTAQALEQAREALRDAMDPNRPDSAQQAEIDRKMQELRDAIQKHMEALAEQARRDGTPMPMDPALPQMNARDLDRLAQKLQDSLKNGKTDDARQQMAELEKLLEALKNARPETGEQREQQRAERRQRAREQMDAVQDIIQREGQVLDRSERRSAESAPPPRPNARPPPQSQPQSQSQQTPPSPPSGPQREGDAKAQAAMRRALGELMQRFGDLTGEVPAPLGEADQAMREAGQALAAGRDSAAGAAAKRAIEALQKGGREMGQQAGRQFGTGQQPGEGQQGEGEGEGEGEGDGSGDGQAFGGTENGPGRTAGPRPGPQPGPGQGRSANRDPLGRPLQHGTSGSAESGDIRVPDDMEQARTREIQEELRRRGADRTRRQNELDYIDRLLNPF